jgi:uncharacterized membrane protein
VGIVRDMLIRAWNFIWDATRRYFIAGLVAFAPIAITFWAIAWIIQRLDNLLLPRVIEWFFPSLEQPVELPPLVGALFTFLVILLSGVIVRHFFGHELVRGWERMLSRVPVARSIYGGIKQLFQAIVTSNDTQSFNRVVLLEYPRKGLWALAFTTGPARGPIEEALPGLGLKNCFVPTTPNPTSGFYLLVPESELHSVDLTVEDAFKVIMSAGLVTPGSIEAEIDARGSGSGSA